MKKISAVLLLVVAGVTGLMGECQKHELDESKYDPVFDLEECWKEWDGLLGRIYATDAFKEMYAGDLKEDLLKIKQKMLERGGYLWDMYKFLEEYYRKNPKEVAIFLEAGDEVCIYHTPGYAITEYEFDEQQSQFCVFEIHLLRVLSGQLQGILCGVSDHPCEELLEGAFSNVGRYPLAFGYSVTLKNGKERAQLGIPLNSPPAQMEEEEMYNVIMMSNSDKSLIFWHVYLMYRGHDKSIMDPNFYNKAGVFLAQLVGGHEIFWKDVIAPGMEFYDAQDSWSNWFFGVEGDWYEQWVKHVESYSEKNAQEGGYYTVGPELL